jgi:hypothetical protein
VSQFSIIIAGAQLEGMNPMLRHVLVIALVLASALCAEAQTVQALKHAAPDGAELEFQLTDGRVLAQGLNNDDWWALTPDAKGSYANGTWKQLAKLPSGYSPYAMASQVLADGRVLIEGGEYNYNNFTLTNLGAIYDPVKNTWTKLSPPRGWANIGDSPSAVMPHGGFAIGNKLDERMALFDPSTKKWKFLKSTGKHDFNAEEGWTLLPDGSLLTVDVLDNPHSERYYLDKQEWLDAGSTVVDLQGPPACCGCIHYPPHNKCYYPPGEVGPALLMPDGTVFATGATHSGDTTAHTAIYTPSSNSWAAGPDFPNGDQAGDEFASLLPNGHALVEVNSGTLYEFDGKTLTAEPFNVGGIASLLVLPTGNVLIAGAETYTSTGTYQDSWRPTISDCPTTLSRGSTYEISGTQFNGLSQANAFGDELQSATNYPLVRITNKASHDVFYARTHDHSSMGVATGTLTVSTNFDVPANMQTGAASLVVVANGIPSEAVAVTVK